MWHVFVSTSDAMTQRFVLGFVDVCSAHPVLSFLFLGLMLALAVSLCVDQIEIRSRNRRRRAAASGPRVIQVRR